MVMERDEKFVGATLVQVSHKIEIDKEETQEFFRFSLFSRGSPTKKNRRHRENKKMKKMKMKRSMNAKYSLPCL